MRLLTLALLLSCGAEKAVCEPGETQLCVCPTGDAGAQVCDDAGTSWHACACDVSAGEDDDHDDDDDDDDDSTPWDSGQTEGDAAEGASVYATYCAACHGPTGHGGSGPDLRREVPEQSDAELAEIITEGEDDMPGFALSAQQLADLIAWLRAQFGEEEGGGGHDEDDDDD